MHRGWIRLYRKLQDNPLWTEGKFTPGQAWVDLILIANHRKGHIRVRGVRVDVSRGQVAHSEKTLASRWKWSRGKVRRFLTELHNEGMIVHQKNNVINLITIINYNEHQTDGTPNSTPNGTADSTTDGQQTVQQTDTNKNDKNVNNEKKKERALPFTSYFPTDWQKHEKFVEWCDKWDEHRKKKKWPRTKLAYEAQAEKLLEYDIDTAIRAIRDSIQGGWQGVFPKQEKGNGPFKGTTAEQKADALRKLHSDISDATQRLQWAKDELEFTPKPGSKDRIKRAEDELAKLTAQLEGDNG
jgi:hypothetical protein